MATKIISNMVLTHQEEIIVLLLKDYKDTDRETARIWAKREVV